MSLLKSVDEREMLAAILESRVKLAKKTVERAVCDAVLEYHRTLQWIKSTSQKDYSFEWYCDEFNLDAGVVRKAITAAHTRDI